MHYLVITHYKLLLSRYLPLLDLIVLAKFVINRFERFV
ncbi:hypothetical protein M2109_003991 [Paenibacillus sp. PastH-3]|nr:hypothetical protein [Paenibacillus sp. PastH-4]MDH6445783.1 hypothetical protein [Paenibacillus sp. PastF-4]MDH6529670.1 hypothetical protein [Paenibacillus sp. PastH-3]